MTHAPEQSYSVRTHNKESRQAIFNSVKVASKLTSKHHPNNVLSNAVIQLHAKNKLFYKALKSTRIIIFFKVERIRSY